MDAEDYDLITYVQTQIRDSPKLINNKLNNSNSLNHRKEYFKIENHVKNFLSNDSSQRFIVMPGLRGVGKTTILFQLYEFLISQGISNEDILYLDVNELSTFFNSDIYSVVDIFLKNIQQTNMVNLKRKVFLLIDEAHFDEKWSLAGKLIFDKTDNIFMIFTGSSALDLEMNVDASRRSIKEPIFPLNFCEYLNLFHDIEMPNISFSELILKGDISNIDNNQINVSFMDLDTDPNVEFERFLINYGFPFSFDFDIFDNCLKIVDLIERIISLDIPKFKTFKTTTNRVISRIISYIALQKPGGTSNIKLAQFIGVSPKTVNDILNVLEKTQLIFSIKPYGSASKMVKKPWQYFFSSPSIKAMINYKVGRYDVNSRKCIASLAENMVASMLFKLKQENQFLGVFYDSDNGGVDFLVKHIDTIIPIEVGIGKKTKSQLTRAMARYDSPFGILVSNRTPIITKKDNIIYVPLMYFGLM